MRGQKRASLDEERDLAFRAVVDKVQPGDPRYAAAQVQARGGAGVNVAADVGVDVEVVRVLFEAGVRDERVAGRLYEQTVSLMSGYLNSTRFEKRVAGVVEAYFEQVSSGITAEAEEGGERMTLFDAVLAEKAGEFRERVRARVEEQWEEKVEEAAKKIPRRGGGASEERDAREEGGMREMGEEMDADALRVRIERYSAVGGGAVVVLAVEEAERLLDAVTTAERRCREYEVSLSAVRLDAERQRERTSSVVSEPGNAWDVIVADRDEWKRRALAAEEDLRAARSEGRLASRGYESVREALREADPEGLIKSGAPDDEYDSEAAKAFVICAAFEATLGLDEATASSVLREVLRRSFGDVDREQAARRWTDERLGGAARALVVGVKGGGG